MDANRPNFFRTILGVLRLDTRTYVEIAGYGAATSQAIIIVLAAATVYGVTGYAISPLNALVGFFGRLLIWVFLTAITHFICNAFANTPDRDRSFSRTARLMGFAEAPGLFGIAELIPSVGPLITLVLGLWSLLTWFNAVKVAGPFSSQGTCLVLILQIICLIILVFLFLFLFLLIVGAPYITFGTE